MYVRIICRAGPEPEDELRMRERENGKFFNGIMRTSELNYKSMGNCEKYMKSPPPLKKRKEKEVHKSKFIVV